MLRVLGGLHNAVYRWTGGRVGGRMGKAPVLLLSVTGRRSGRRRTTPLLYGRDGGSLVVIASVGGAPRNPAWYLNLQGQEADVQVGAEHIRVRARDAEGEERERLWAQMVALYPTYESYRRKTARRIPVVVLERVQERSSGAVPCDR
jgi:deazaflavin-dependent oxidoreductase (nitroreductase family)